MWTQTEIDDSNIGKFRKFLRAEIDGDCIPYDGFLVEKAQANGAHEDGRDGLWIQVVIGSQDPKRVV